MAGDAENGRWLALLEGLRPRIQAKVRRKLQVTLSPHDGRTENQDALELCSAIETEIWVRFQAPEQPHAPESYALTVADHAIAEYLRGRRRPRTRLSNALRYFLRHHARFAVWSGDDADAICGWTEWRGHAPVPVLNPAGAPDIPRWSFDQMTAARWAELMNAWFRAAGAPQDFDDLVNALAPHLGCLEAETPPPETPPRTPEQHMEALELLELLWHEVVRLPPRQRAAWLLNLTAGDIEVFPANRVASPAEIEAVLNLSADQYGRLWTILGVVPPPEGDRPGKLWACLPLPDDAIAAMMGCERIQVIGLRRLARAKLAAKLSPHPRSI